MMVLFICGLLSTLAYDELQARIGARDVRNDADTDIAGNVRKLKYSGKTPYCRMHMVAIYEERYDISLEYVGGCCPSPYRSAYNSAYNEGMYAAIRIRDPEFDPSRAYEEVRDVAGARFDVEWNDRQR
jgi:hypothetical protein